MKMILENLKTRDRTTIAENVAPDRKAAALQSARRAFFGKRGSISYTRNIAEVRGEAVIYFAD